MTGRRRSHVLRYRAAGIFLAVSCGTASAAQAGTPCTAATLRGLGVHGVSVLSAQAVAAAGANPAYCDVIGRLATEGDGISTGSAGFELRLPVNWNKKFLFFGVGGLAGATIPDLSVNPVDVGLAVARGYALAITDEGHVSGGTDSHWALLAPGRPDQAKLADYYYRATHDVTVATKQLTQLFFGSPSIERAYFDGCSNGGRQALVEATRFPDDYDGVIAGDPFLDIRAIIGGLRNAKQFLTPQTYLPATLLPMIDAAVAASCRRADGVDDGLIQNPAACHFDPYSLVCAPGHMANCLSAGQADTLSAYFSATRTGDGAVVYPGFSVSNLATSATGPLAGEGADVWTFGLLPPKNFSAREPWGNDGYDPAGIAYQFADHVIPYIVVRDPNYVVRDFPVSPQGYVTPDALAIYDAATSAGNAADPEAYEPFFRRGRKLIIYHGYSDPALTPFRTINLYRQLEPSRDGYAEVQDSARLFMVPGMQHCLGGPGPNVFDTLSALEGWVEKGVAPASLLATHYVNNDPASAVDRTMPLCPFPTQATYIGGDVAKAASWSCTPNARLLETGPNGRQAGVVTGP